MFLLKAKLILLPGLDVYNFHLMGPLLSVAEPPCPVLMLVHGAVGNAQMHFYSENWKL